MLNVVRVNARTTLANTIQKSATDLISCRYFTDMISQQNHQLFASVVYKETRRATTS